MKTATNGLGGECISINGKPWIPLSWRSRPDEYLEQQRQEYADPDELAAAEEQRRRLYPY